MRRRIVLYSEGLYNWQKTKQKMRCEGYVASVGEKCIESSFEKTGRRGISRKI
jgi:hypothetical protein